MNHSNEGTRIRTAAARCLAAGLACMTSGCGNSPDTTTVLDTGPAASAVIDTMLFGVRDLQVAPSGEIWVLSRHDPYIRRFTPEGNLAASFGRNGDGPGEFRVPWSFVNGDRRVPPRVIDPAHRLIVQVDTGGKELARWPLRTDGGFLRSDFEDVSYGQVFRAFAPSDSELVTLVYLGDVGTTRDLRRSALVRFSSRGTALDTLFSFQDLFGVQRDGAVARWLVTVPLMAGCPDGSTAVYDGVAPEVRGYGQGPGPIWRVAVPPRVAHKRPMPAADLERYMRYRVRAELVENHSDTTTLDRLVSDGLRTSGGWYASTVPVAVELLCDDRNRIWLESFDTREDPVGKGPIWTVIPRQGEALTVRFPNGFTPLRFTPAGAFGISRDSLGAESVARVVLPGRLATYSLP